MITAVNKTLRAPQLVPAIVTVLLAFISLGPIPGCPCSDSSDCPPGWCCDDNCYVCETSPDQKSTVGTEVTASDALLTALGLPPASIAATNATKVEAVSNDPQPNWEAGVLIKLWLAWML